MEGTGQDRMGLEGIGGDWIGKDRSGRERKGRVFLLTILRRPCNDRYIGEEGKGSERSG